MYDIYVYCILIYLCNVSLIIIFYYCFSVIVLLILFLVVCFVLDYYGISRRLFVGLDNGIILVSVFFLYLFILVFVKYLRNLYVILGYVLMFVLLVMYMN